MPESGGAEQARIRVVVQEPALPKYRVPVFRELASRPGLDVLLTYGRERLIKNVEADGFHSEPSRSRWWRTPVGLIGWDPSQVRNASRKRCDVVVLDWNTRVLSLFPALIRARLSGVGVVLWGHGYSKRESGLRRWFRLLPTRLAGSVVFYNRAAAKATVERGVPGEKVFVALNSLDQTEIGEQRARLIGDPEPVRELRRAYGLGGAMVLFVSRLLRQNRLDLLFDALKLLGDRFPDLRVAVVGSGPDEAYLCGYADKIGVRDRVVFAGAVYEESELGGWFMASDVFCYPANIGLSMLHAFGYGLPVVTSDRIESQNPEIEALRDGGNGLLYRDGDASALSEALGRILGDKGFRRRLSDEALRTVREEFTITRMIDGMQAAIRYAYRTSRAIKGGPVGRP
jgi:glycosyltransferase involved in cell wall biosynthesis